MANIVFEITASSGKRVRLTDTMQRKIESSHPEFQRQEYLAEIKQALEDPDYVIKGWTNEYLSLKWCLEAPKAPKFLCVVHRELNGDGFVITAFFVSRYERLLRRQVLWQRS